MTWNDLAVLSRAGVRRVWIRDDWFETLALLLLHGQTPTGRYYGPQFDPESRGYVLMHRNMRVVRRSERAIA